MGLFETIPLEIIVDIIGLLDGKDLLNFCANNKQISNICENEYIWKRKVEELKTNSRVDRIPDKPGNMSWKELYIQMTNIIPVQIILRGENIGEIYVKTSDTIEDVNQLANTKLPRVETFPILSMFRGRQNEILGSISQPLSQAPRYLKLARMDKIGKIGKFLKKIEYVYSGFLA